MISEAKQKHLNSLVKLHRKVLPNTSSSRFGYDFVRRLYTQLLSDKNSKVWVYATNGNIVGFLSITSKMKYTTKLIMSGLTASNYIKILLKLLSSPLEIPVFLKRLYFDDQILKSLGNYPNILTVGVLPQYQGTGIGTKFINIVDQYFKKKGLKQYFVDTEQKNINAINFYKRNNFILVRSFSNNVLLKKVINR
jgi:ribosomal protein S18 acetylase RimI-like enzyme